MTGSLRRAASRGWLVALAGALAAPASAFAATPEGTTGGSGIIPEPDLLSVVLDVAVKVAAISIGVGVLIALGYGLARIGGAHAQGGPATGLPAGDRPRSARAWSVGAIVTGAACIIGVLVGRQIAYDGSRGGLGGILGSAVDIFFVVAAVLGLAAVGAIATLFRRGRVTSAIVTVFGAAALLLTGAIGGHATAAAFGGLYREPVVLQARGATTQVQMQPISGPFVAKVGGLASCNSAPDGRTVVGFTALELGELGAGTLRADLTVAGDTSDPLGGSFFIDGADVPDGVIQPFWTASVAIVEIGSGGTSGTLTFNAVADSSAEKPQDPSATPPPASGWPPTIAGTIAWTCQPW